MNHPLERKADIRTLRRLYQNGYLNEEAFHAAQGILRPPDDWFIWARQLLLFIGSALVLSGVIFFFAYNWDKMGRFYKLGILEAGVVVCAVMSQFRRRAKIESSIWLLSAGVLVGVLMAVYGQIYQTGADAYELFVNWAILIFGWAVISKFTGFWFLWLVILNAGLILYWVQVGHPAHGYAHEYLWLALAGLNGAALILREIGALAKREWLMQGWLRIILLLGMLTALSIPTTLLIVDYGHVHAAAALAAVNWVIVAVIGFWFYRFFQPDFLALGFIIMNACYLVITLICKIIFDHVRQADAGVFLMIAVIILVIVSAAAFWLRLLAQQVKAVRKEYLYEK